MEAIKSYRIPVEAPKDLIDEYFLVKQKALSFILQYVKFSNSKRAHLELRKDERRKLRDEMLKDWKFSKHYVDSAMNSIIGLVKGWIMLYNRGKSEKPPEIARKTVYIKTRFSASETAF